MSDLEAALAAAEVSDFPTALDALLRAFATVRAAPIAELVERVSARLPQQTPIKTSRGRDKFARIAALGRAADIPMLIESASAVGGLTLLAKRPPDPRLARAFASELAALPMRAPGSKPYYATLFGAVVRIADPQVLPILRGARGRIETLGVPAFRTWMLERLAEVIAELGALPTIALEPDDATLATRIRAVLDDDRAAHQTANNTVHALEAECYANPDDLGPRHVLADALAQIGDPRGELIALQLLPDLDRKQRARVNAIIREHRERLLGPIAEWVLADGLVFERGFPVRGRIRDGLYTSGGPPDVPNWSTFHTLDIHAEPSIAYRKALRWLRHIEGARADFVTRLTRLDTPWRLESIDFRELPRTVLEALAPLIGAATLPALRAIRWWIPYGAEPEPISELIAPTQLDTIGLRGHVTAAHVIPLLACVTSSRTLVVECSESRAVVRDRAITLTGNEPPYFAAFSQAGRDLGFAVERG